MSTDPSPKADRLDPFQIVFRSVWYRLILLFFGAYQTVFWFVLGPSNPWYAVGLVGTTFALGPALAGPVMKRVPRRWFRVPSSEHVLHRMLGVGLFGRLLEVSGWNRVVAKPMRGFSGTRAGLASLEQSVRGNISAHGGCFAVHVVLAIFALFSRHPWRGALWMLVPAIVVHLYPVLLQRSIMLRLQPLLDQCGV